MKNFHVFILTLFIICVIPVTTANSQIDDVITGPEVSNEGLKTIEKLSDPRASAYLIIRNSNDELVGISHVHANRYLDSNRYVGVLSGNNASHRYNLFLLLVVFDA